MLCIVRSSLERTTTCYAVSGHHRREQRHIMYCQVIIRKTNAMLCIVRSSLEITTTCYAVSGHHRREQGHVMYCQAIIRENKAMLCIIRSSLEGKVHNTEYVIRPIMNDYSEPV